MKIFKTVVCILFGLFMLNSGLNKLLQYMPMPELSEKDLELFGHFTAISWLMPLVAVAEIIGAILFITPRYRALGALIMLPVSVGIVLHHLVLAPEMPGLAIGIVVFAINLWIIADNWRKYRPIWM